MDDNQETINNNPEQRSQKSVGPALGIIIIIAIIILGGFYFWRERETNGLDNQTEMLETYSQSDEIPTIEEDLNQTNLDSLDQELADIDSEIDAAIKGL